MEFNKKNVILFILGIIIILCFFFIKQHSISSKSYKSEIAGIVGDLRSVGRGNAYVQVKFENATNFNQLCVLYLGSNNQEDLKIGDSLYKPENSYEYQIYRKNDFVSFHFFKILKNKP